MRISKTKKEATRSDWKMLQSNHLEMNQLSSSTLGFQGYGGSPEMNHVKALVTKWSNQLIGEGFDQPLWFSDMDHVKSWWCLFAAVVDCSFLFIVSTPPSGKGSQKTLPQRMQQLGYAVLNAKKKYTCVSMQIVWIFTVYEHIVTVPPWPTLRARYIILTLHPTLRQNEIKNSKHQNNT